MLEDGVEFHGAAAALDGVLRQGVEVELEEMEGDAVEGQSVPSGRRRDVDGVTGVGHLVGHGAGLEVEGREFGVRRGVVEVDGRLARRGAQPGLISGQKPGPVSPK